MFPIRFVSILTIFVLQYSKCEVRHQDGSPDSIFRTSHRPKEKAIGQLFNELSTKNYFCARQSMLQGQNYPITNDTVTNLTKMHAQNMKEIWWKSSHQSYMKDCSRPHLYHTAVQLPAPEIQYTKQNHLNRLWTAGGSRVWWFELLRLSVDAEAECWCWFIGLSARAVRRHGVGPLVDIMTAGDVSRQDSRGQNVLTGFHQTWQRNYIEVTVRIMFVVSKVVYYVFTWRHVLDQWKQLCGVHGVVLVHLRRHAML